jgi:hypothetical protein
MLKQILGLPVRAHVHTLKAVSGSMCLLLCFLYTVQAQSSAFTYQGKLTDGGTAANGQYDLTFRLFDAAAGGSQIGPDVVRDDVQVTTGIFTVNLDFGTSPFTTATGNFLEISVRAGASTGVFISLAPLQPITSSPYAVQTIRAQSSALADDSVQLGGVNANQYVQTTDPRMSDARTPTAGSDNYIQNQNASAQTGDFNIAGNGTVGGSFSASGVTTSSIGSPAGILSILGTGTDILSINRRVTALNEFRANSGILTHSIDNSAAANLFFGSNTATSVQIGGTGTLANPGPDAIRLNGKTFVSGALSTFGGLLTSNIDTASTNPLSIGFGNATGVNIHKPTTISGLLTANGGITTSGTLSANIFDAATQYNIGGSRVLSIPSGQNLFVGPNTGVSNTGFSNTFLGWYAGSTNTTGSQNTFVGDGTANQSTTGNNNSFLGYGAGYSNSNGSGNTLIGFAADVGSASNATALGSLAYVAQSNSLVLGSINGINGCIPPLCDSVSVGIGTTAPGYRLDVVGRSRFKQSTGNTGPTDSAGLWFFQNAPNDDRAFIGMESDNSVGLYGNNGGNWGLVMNTQTGITSVNVLGAAGSTSLCRNALNQISTCTPGSLTRGEEIDRLREQIAKQQVLIDELKQIVCTLKPDALVCMEKNK